MVAFATWVASAYMNLPGKGRRTTRVWAAIETLTYRGINTRYTLPMGVVITDDDAAERRGRSAGARAGHGASVIASWDSERNELVHDDA